MAAGFLKNFLSFTQQPNDVALPEVNFDLRIARASDVEKVWKSVQAEATAQGKYPVFLGKQSELPLLLELAEYEERDVDTLIKEGLRLDVAQWFENQFADH